MTVLYPRELKHYELDLRTVDIFYGSITRYAPLMAAAAASLPQQSFGDIYPHVRSVPPHTFEAGIFRIVICPKD